MYGKIETEVRAMSKPADVRNMTVVKANELIQKSRFSLSVQQQKVVLYLIAQISPHDDDFDLYEFSIPEFCKVCGIDYTNGKNYHDLKAAIKEIADKSVWVDIEDEETLLRWIEKPYINKNDGVIKIRLDKDMKPFLLQLKKNFTQYELLWTLHFRSKYTIRLYELVKSVHYDELNSYTREYSLDALKKVLGAETYTTYQTFKTRVLIPAINEINAGSDKTVEWQPLKKGRSVDRIRLTITTKDVVSRTELRGQIEKELGLDQISLWED